MNSVSALIDSDFALLSFKINRDIPTLIHYLPSNPDLIAYSDFQDSYTQTKLDSPG